MELVTPRLGVPADIFRWENENLLPGPSFGIALNHLSKIGIRETSRELEADVLGASVRGCILEPFRWKVSELQIASPKKKKSRIAKASGHSKNPRSPHASPHNSRRWPQSTYSHSSKQRHD
jgi:hypothetical protein